MAENIDIVASFSNQNDFIQWCQNSSAFDAEHAVHWILNNGVDSGFFGHVSPRNIEIKGPNFREQLHVNGLNSRQRAILELLIIEDQLRSKRAKIYAPEAVTNLAGVLRGRFPYFLGSEYASTDFARDDLYPIPSEDLLNLTLKSSAFDAVISCDVLEHVPDIQRSLSEMSRILKPGGVMLSTHPFTWTSTSLCKAELINNEIVYHCKPEYHGNPVSENGSLVFTIPGWDILNQCRAAGFSRVEMVFILSITKGIFGHTPQFINVLRAYK